MIKTAIFLIGIIVLCVFCYKVGYMDGKHQGFDKGYKKGLDKNLRSVYRVGREARKVAPECNCKAAIIYMKKWICPLHGKQKAPHVEKS